MIKIKLINYFLKYCLYRITKIGNTYLKSSLKQEKKEMIQTPFGTHVDHPCTGQCYKLSPLDEATCDSDSKRDVSEQKSKEAVTVTKPIEISLAEKLKRDVFTVRLEPLQNKMMCNCVSMPCGYPVYGCSCGQKDVVIEFRYVPDSTCVPIPTYWCVERKEYKVITYYSPEIWASGHHTPECLFKMGKTIEEVCEAETTAASAVEVEAQPVVKVTEAEKLLSFLDYPASSAPSTGLRKKKGSRDGNLRRLKKRPKRAKSKVGNHHVDVRVHDPLPISKSDSLFWDSVLDKDYTYYCDCEEEQTIRLKSATQAFNSDFKCSTCGSRSGLADYIMQMGQEHYDGPLWENDDWDMYSDYDDWDMYPDYDD